MQRASIPPPTVGYCLITTISQYNSPHSIPAVDPSHSTTYLSLFEVTT